MREAWGGGSRGDVWDGQGVDGEARQAGGVAPHARLRCPASAYWQRLGMTGTEPGGLGQHR